MKQILHILLILSACLALSHEAVAGSTVQVSDIIIIDKVKHQVNQPLMFQIDSASYFMLKEKLDFNSSIFSWNFRGHVATFEIKCKKLFLNNIESSFAVHDDFRGILDKYMDRKGRVFASWISGTFICGSGECLYVAQNGFDSVYERETEVVVENGVVVSLRSYSNKSYGKISLEDVGHEIMSKFELDKIKAPAGRITVKVDASEFTDEGKVARWSVVLLRGCEGLSEDVSGQIVNEVDRVFSLFEWKTYCRDGEWRLALPDGVICPLIFK